MPFTSSQVGSDGGVHVILSKFRAVVCEVISHNRDTVKGKQGKTEYRAINQHWVFWEQEQSDLQFLEGETGSILHFTEADEAFAEESEIVPQP